MERNLSARPRMMPWTACSANERELRAEALAQEIVELSAHIAAAEARWLELIARFDAEELWAVHGAHSCAHWLNWQCGISLHAARERVRVARALEGLPRIREAFARGEVSYSKVRAMTRIAVPESEEMLLNIARHGTAAHMDRLVRAYRRVERLEAAAEAMARYRSRSVRYRYEEDGMLVITVRLPAEIGEVVRRAIDSAMELLYRDGMRKEREEESERRGAAEPVEVECGGAVVATLDDAGEVQVKFETQAGVAAGTCAGGVPAGTRAVATADVPAGTSVSAARLDDSPPFPGCHKTPGGHAVVEEFEGQEWNDSVAARRADALRLLAESYLAGGWRQLAGDTPLDTSADRYQVVVHIDQALLSEARRESSRPTTDLGRCALDDGPALAIDTARRLACDSVLVGIVDDENGEPLNVGRKTRAIPPALRRALRARDGGCRFPTCDRTLFLHAHHVEHWADGGETKLSNLVSLCTYHHTLVHEGGFDVKVTDDGAFVFYDPTGKPLPTTGRLSQRTLDVLAQAAAERRVTLEDQHKALGFAVSAEAAACRWSGERMDYGLAVDCLVQRRDRARRGAELGPC